MIENLELILPEIFISLSIMLFLMIGVYKKNSSSLVYSLSTVSLLVLFALLFNFYPLSEASLFNESYKIDKLANFMKILLLCQEFLLC